MSRNKNSKSSSNNNKEDKNKHFTPNKDLELTDKKVEDFLKKYNYYSDPVLYDDKQIDDTEPDI